MIKKYLGFGLLAFLFMVPAFCFTQSAAEADARSLLSAFISYVDLRISGVQNSLEVLASASEVRSGEWKTMQGLLGAYQKTDGGLIVFYVLPDGSYYTVDKGLMDAKLSDRSYFPDLMAGRRVIGSLVISKSTGQRSAVIAVPLKAGEKVVGAIGASVFLDKLADQIDSALAPRKDVAFFALAPNGLTALHRKIDRHFLDPREMGSETLKKAVNEILSKTEGEVTYDFDNTLKKAIFRKSDLTQWRFAINMNAASGK